jgi:hypothetical protein
MPESVPCCACRPDSGFQTALLLLPCQPRTTLYPAGPGPQAISSFRACDDRPGDSIGSSSGHSVAGPGPGLGGPVWARIRHELGSTSRSTRLSGRRPLARGARLLGRRKPAAPLSGFSWLDEPNKRRYMSGGGDHPNGGRSCADVLEFVIQPANCAFQGDLSDSVGPVRQVM